MMFGIRFVIVPGIKAAEGRCQTAKCTDQAQLCGAILGHQAETCLLDEGESLLRLCLHLREGIAHEQIIRDQFVPAIGRERKVPRSISDIESPPDQIPSLRGVLRPRWERAKRNVGSRLVARQVALFDEIVAQLAETEPILVIVEARSSEHPKPYIAETRRIAVTVLQTKTYHAANHQRGQILIEKHGWVDDFGEYIEHVEDVWIVEQWQVHEFLDLTVSNQ